MFLWLENQDEEDGEGEKQDQKTGRHQKQSLYNFSP